MATNKPAVTGRQLDRCDICGNKAHKHDLVRTQVEYLQHAGSNSIIQSSWDNSHWADNDSADLGEISVGVYADYQRLSLDTSNDFTEKNGAHTVSTAKMLYTTVAMTDPSAWTNVCFSFEGGPYHRSTTPETTFTFGVYDIGDTATLYQQKSWTTKTQRRMWWTATPAELTADGVTLSTLGFYIVGTGSSWWADCFQCEDATEPGNFIATNGSAVTESVDAARKSVRKVCPRCRERVWRVSEQYGKPDESPIDMPVVPWIQDI
jgi:hypothetical protein